MRSLRARAIRRLALEDGRHISAASGLARARGRLYVAADDELALGVFPVGSGAPGARLVLADEELPSEREARKAAKADLEAVATLPAAGLLVMGSGSGDNRHRGFVTSLDGGEVREIDLHRLHEAIGREVGGPVNLEGAEWHAGRLLLAHRGVAGAASAVVRVGWPDLAVEDVSPLVTETLDGVPLGITDLARLPDGRLLASYAAENAPDAYADGPVTGSAIGFLGEEPMRLAGPWKVEGLWSDGREVLMVTDADDPGEPALLLRATLPA